MTVRQSLLIITAISLLILPIATACNNTESPSFPTWPGPESSWGKPDYSTVVKYSSNSSQYFIENEPIKYSYEELNRAVTGMVTSDVKEACLPEILEYIYAFPGYEYRSITGTIRINPRENVVITIRGRGLEVEFIDKSINGNGERYEFEFESADGDNYNMVDFSYSFYIIPREIYEDALLLANEHPVVQKFLLDHDLTLTSMNFGAWFDALKATDPRYLIILDKYDLQQHIRGIIRFDIYTDSYYALSIYVDMYSGEVFTLGPTYSPPI